MSDVKVHYTEIHVSIKNNIKVDLLLKIVYSNICCFSEFSLKKNTIFFLISEYLLEFWISTMIDFIKCAQI